MKGMNSPWWYEQSSHRLYTC